MFKTRKILSVALSLAIMMNIFAIGSAATLGDGDALTAVVHLEVGTMNGTVFTPLPAGKALHTDDIITVRICPQTDFLCGATRYAVMFSNDYFSIVGTGKNAFVPNTANSFYANAASGWAGATTVPSTAWPASLVSQYAQYKAVCVSNLADVTSNNGGYPDYLPGDWLFRFNLKVKSDIPAGSGAKVWMDGSWFQTPADTTAAGYFAKVEPGLVYDDILGDYRPRYSTESDSISYNFKFEINDNISLEPQVSTISFNSSGGSAVADIQGYVGDTVTPPANPVLAGHTFTAWDPVLPAVFPLGGLSVVAQWELNSYNITFDANGGTGGETKSVAYGAMPVAPQVTKQGYIFAGWDNEIAPVTGTAIYTAQWVPASDTPYTVNIYKSIIGLPDGYDLFDSYQRTGTTGSEASVIPDVYEGFNFNSADSVTSGTILADGSLILNLYYRRNVVKITFNTDGGTSIADLIGEYGATVTAPENPVKEGYTFSNWDKSIPLIFPAEDILITAGWNINYYTVTFDANGGTGGEVQTLAYGAMPAAPAVSRTGYTFDGWSPAVTAVTGKVTYTAQWTPVNYTITFEANGGTGGEVQTVAYGVTPTAPVVTKTGYTFDRWTPSIVAVTGDATYTAQWDINHYTITFDANGGTGGEVQTLAFGATPAAPEVVREGYTFAGWAPEIAAVTDDATYTAQWDINHYTITFDANGGTGGEVQTLAYGATPAAPTVAKEGYTFDSWTPSIVAVTGDATYTAQWDINYYTVTFDANGGTGGEVQTLAYGATPSAPTVVKEGYTFAGWDPEIAAVTGDATYTAQWNINHYTITFDANGGTGGEVQTVAYGTTPTAPAVSRTGYTFAGWDKDIAPATADTTYIAQWLIITYTYMWDPNGGTWWDGTTGPKYTYSGNQPIIVPMADAMTPPGPIYRTGYTFTGWSPSIPQTVPAADTTFTAQWTINSYTITFDANGGTGGETQTLPYDTIPTAPVVTRTGYTFDSWTPSIEAVTGDATYTAQWDINYYTVTFDANGGTGGEVQTVAYGTTPTAPVVSKTGYTFTGWDKEIAPATADTTYIAQWLIITYIYMWNPNGGTWWDGTTGPKYTYSGNQPIIVPMADAMTPPGPVYRTGYTFSGWDPVIPSTLPPANTTFTAQWTINSYTITFDANGGTGGEVQTLAYGTTPIAPTVVREGYTFAGWSPEITAVTGNATYTAQWDKIIPKTGTIIFDTAGGTPIDPITGNVGDTVVPPADPTKTGCAFIGWSRAIPETIPDGEITLVAQWKMLGDIDSDGDWDVLDALMALQGSSGVRELTEAQIAVADVDGDGRLSVLDALIILQFVSGIRTDFPVNIH